MRAIFPKRSQSWTIAKPHHTLFISWAHKGQETLNHIVCKHSYVERKAGNAPVAPRDTRYRIVRLVKLEQIIGKASKQFFTQ